MIRDRFRDRHGHWRNQVAGTAEPDDLASSAQPSCGVSGTPTHRPPLAAQVSPPPTRKTPGRVHDPPIRRQRQPASAPSAAEGDQHRNPVTHRRCDAVSDRRCGPPPGASKADDRWMGRTAWSSVRCFRGCAMWLNVSNEELPAKEQLHFPPPEQIERAAAYVEGWRYQGTEQPRCAGRQGDDAEGCRGQRHHGEQVGELAGHRLDRADPGTQHPFLGQDDEAVVALVQEAAAGQADGYGFGDVIHTVGDPSPPSRPHQFPTAGRHVQCDRCCRPLCTEMTIVSAVCWRESGHHLLWLLVRRVGCPALLMVHDQRVPARGILLVPVLAGGRHMERPGRRWRYQRPVGVAAQAMRRIREVGRQVTASMAEHHSRHVKKRSTGRAGCRHDPHS